MTRRKPRTGSKIKTDLPIIAFASRTEWESWLAHRADNGTRLFADADLRFASTDAPLEDANIGSIPEEVSPSESEALGDQPPASEGVWLKLAKAASGIASISKQEAIDGALCHGWIDGQLAPYDSDFWLVRFTPRQPRSKWSEVNRKRALVLIETGRMKPGGLREIERAKLDGRWDAAYAPQSKATVPDDLQAALDGNGAAKRRFAELDSRNRYAILYRVQDAKRPETRAERIRKYVAMLEQGGAIYPAK